MSIDEIAKRIKLEDFEILAIRDWSIDSGKSEEECVRAWRRGAAIGWKIESLNEIENILSTVSA